MKLVWKFNCESPPTQLLEWCKVANNLYNQALFIVKSTLESENKFLFYNDLNKLMQTTPNLDGEVNYRRITRG